MKKVGNLPKTTWLASRTSRARKQASFLWKQCPLPHVFVQCERMSFLLLLLLLLEDVFVVDCVCVFGDWGSGQNSLLYLRYSVRRIVSAWCVTYTLLYKLGYQGKLDTASVLKESIVRIVIKVKV